MAINNVNVSAAPAGALPAQTAPDNTVAPKQTSTMTKVALTGLTCLAVYCIAGLVKGKINGHNNLKYCKGLAESSSEIIESAKKEKDGLEKLLNEFKTEAQKKNINEGCLIKNNDGSFNFVDKLSQTLNKNSDAAYDAIEYEAGKPVRIISGITEEISGKAGENGSKLIRKAGETPEAGEEIITRHFKEMLDLRNENETRFLKKGRFVSGSEKAPATTMAEQIFSFDKENKIKSFGANYAQKGDTTTFGILAKCKEDGLPVRVEFGSDYTPEKNSMTQLYEFRENGGWKRQ